MDRVKVELLNPQQAHQMLTQTVWPAIKAHIMAGTQLVLEVRGKKRSDAQNSLMWSCAGDLSKQVKWFGKHLTPEGWVRFITGHLNGQELVPNMDGTGFISLEKGKSTSDMTIKEMTAVIELMHAFGADQGVKWSPTSQGRLTHEARIQNQQPESRRKATARPAKGQAIRQADRRALLHGHK